MTILAWLWAKVSGYAAAAGAIAAAIFAVWLKGRQDGKRIMKEEQDRHRAEAIAAKRKSDSEIDNLAPADLDHRMDRWVRKDNR
ncbi:hypothetical protein [Bosea lathyri]|uniref:ABC transporter permease n=1 Tax=Bosea lathyri TaxID=1036778 RepID=A0A1H6BVZ3_9HYPH|nr:hypothetical protein [Bosea lathyri]SEG64850.1 hypothetical protein SAMN04488115_108132 [Bosea lathyri]